MGTSHWLLSSACDICMLMLIYEALTSFRSIDVIMTPIIHFCCLHFFPQLLLFLGQLNSHQNFSLAHCSRRIFNYCPALIRCKPVNVLNQLYARSASKHSTKSFCRLSPSCILPKHAINVMLNYERACTLFNRTKKCCQLLSRHRNSSNYRAISVPV